MMSPARRPTSTSTAGTSSTRALLISAELSRASSSDTNRHPLPERWHSASARRCASGTGRTATRPERSRSKPRHEPDRHEPFPLWPTHWPKPADAGNAVVGPPPEVAACRRRRPRAAPRPLLLLGLDLRDVAIRGRSSNFSGPHPWKPELLAHELGPPLRFGYSRVHGSTHPFLGFSNARLFLPLARFDPRVLEGRIGASAHGRSRRVHRDLLPGRHRLRLLGLALRKKGHFWERVADRLFLVGLACTVGDTIVLVVSIT